MVDEQAIKQSNINDPTFFIRIGRMERAATLMKDCSMLELKLAFAFCQVGILTLPNAFASGCGSKASALVLHSYDYDNLTAKLTNM